MVHFWSVLFLIQYLLSVYTLCRALGTSERPALFGSILSVFAPTLLCQALTSYNDLPVAVLFATTLAFAVNMKRGMWQRVGTALSCGLLLSTKLSAALLCVIPLACGVLVDVRDKVKGRWIDAVKPTLAIGAIALVLGGWWPLRNLVEYRNPFFPFEAKIAGVGFDGRISPMSEMRMLNSELAALPRPVRLWRLWREERSHFGLWLYNYDSAYAGFGPLFFVLGLPSLAAACAISLFHRNWPTAAVLLLSAGAYVGFSGSISPRLSLFILPVMGLSLSVVFNSMHREPPWNRFPGLPLAIKSAAIALASYTFLVAGAAPFAPQTLRAQLYSMPRDKDSIDGTFLNGFVQVRKAIPRHATVAYDENTAFIWPLWRSDWSNEVHFLPTAAGWERWRINAARFRVTHVVVGRPQPSRLQAWVEQHPENFKFLAKGGFGALYEYKE
jgi:hypothetical protein